MVVAALPVQAQLLNDRVEGNRRICSYVGTEQSADGQLVARTIPVPLGQPCPTAAPYRDPNRSLPGNALLTGEVVTGGQRQCNYSQGGVDYNHIVPITQACAATPDLLDRALTEAAARSR